VTDLPKLTIVIPSYNQAQFIERTIKSILSQGYPNLELILMDGGSTDGTMEIVQSYLSSFSHLQSAPDRGQSDAIQKGFAMATGEILTWLNSDDCYLPGTLLKMGTHFRDNPKTEFLYGDYELIDADDRLITRKRQPSFEISIVKYAFLTVPQMSAFWRRSLYERTPGVDPSLRFAMDYDLFVKLGQLSPAVHVPFAIGQFRIHADSKTSTMEEVRQKEDVLVQERYCKYGPKSSPLKFQLVRRWCQARLILKFAADGTLVSRLRDRLGNGFKSLAS
jgi:glycosyltransferase involved in cell wall biosynthesis